MRRKFFAALLVIAMAFQPVAGIIVVTDSSISPVGTADAATSCGLDEYQNDTGAYGSSQAMRGQTGVRVGADTYQFDCEDLSDDLSYYQAAQSMRQAWQSFDAVYGNALQYSELVAWSEMEKATLWEYDNGTSLSAAKTAVESSYGDYYTVKQKNLIANWQAITQASHTWENLSGYDMFTASASLGDYYAGNGDSFNDYESLNEWDVTYLGKGDPTNITLANGSVQEVMTQRYEVFTSVYHSSEDIYMNKTSTHDITPRSGRTTVSHTVHSGTLSMDYTVNVSLSGLTLFSPPDGDGQTSSIWLMFEVWEERIDTTESEHDNFANGSDAYVDAIYNALDAGDITYADAISRATKADQYLSDAATENASFSVIMAGLNAAGIDSYDPINTSYMTIEFDAERYANSTNPITRDGAILSRYMPSGGWEYNVTYNSGNISGGQMVTALDGDEYVINGSFRIIQAYDNNGDPMPADQISQPDDTRLEVENATSYTTWMQQQEERLIAIEEALSDDSDTVVGGVSDGSSFSLPDWLNPTTWIPGLPTLPDWLVALLVGLLAVLIIR